MDKDAHINYLISPSDTLRRGIEVIDAAAIQIALVVDEQRHLIGTLTDGDIRRGIMRGVSLDDGVELVMNTSPVSAKVGTPPDELMSLMTNRIVKQLPLLDDAGRVVGLERLDRLIKGPGIKDNPVIILAGGQGSRLRPMTNNIPKPLLQVGGHPMVEVILRQLRAYGFRRFFISVNYLGQQIEDYLGDGSRYGIKIEYLREPEPLGTAGPLALLPKPLDLPCIVVNGDLLTRVNFEQLLEFHSEGDGLFTIGVKEHTFQVPFGVVVTEGDRVKEFQEKPEEARLINAGVYVLSPSIINMVPQNSYFDMNQLIEKSLTDRKTRVNAFLIHEYWMDIGTAPDYQQAQWDFPVHFPPPA